jgi:membrane-bound inhibitor of C-type lysozyme
MKNIIKPFTIVALLATTTVNALPLADYTFKSPAFNGSGYSSHVLTIENQEYTRQKAVRDAIQAAIDKAAADKNNTNLAKFLNNLESRIYAQISQNLASAMFANNNCTSSNNVGCSGTLNFEGNTIFWTKSSTDVTLQVTDTVGNQTTIHVPLGQFQF